MLTATLTGADPTSAREIHAALRAFERDFPLVAPALQTVKLDASEFVGTPYSYAVTYPLKDITSAEPPYCIALNPSVWGAGQRPHLLETLADDVQHGFHRFYGPRGVIEHELGHVIDMWVSAQNPLQIPPSYALEYGDSHTISGYAQQSPQEAFAEAFANDRAGLPAGNANVQHVLSASLAIARQGVKSYV